MTECASGQTIRIFGTYCSAMTPEEREQMNRLCERIQIEKDAKIFMLLVEQLNDLLERKEKRFEQNSANSSENLQAAD
jgi:hypothetical protein